MHVLYVIDSLDRPGGAEQALASMAPGLVGAGVRLDVAYLAERPGRDLSEELVAAGATLVPVIESSRRRRVQALAAVIRRQRPDLVHTTLFEADIVGRVASAAVRKPVVSSLVNIAYGPEHRNAPGLRPTKVRAAQAVDALTCRTVRRFHALTDHVASEMGSRLGLRRSRIEVVPRGRDPEVLGKRTATRRAEVRAALGLADDHLVLVAAARHEHQKGLDTLLSAFPAIYREHPEARLVVAGREGNDTALLRRLIGEGDLDDAVQLLGSRNDVPDLIAAADIFVAPSRWEGLGSAVMESMGIGTPIVAGDVAAIRETVSASGARLFRPGDPAALTGALRDVLDDPAATQRRGEVASERFYSRHTIEAVTAGMVGFYEHALD